MEPLLEAGEPLVDALPGRRDEVDEEGEVVEKGGASEVSADLKPGKYTFYCSVPGHEDGGMKGDLTIK